MAATSSIPPVWHRVAHVPHPTMNTLVSKEISSKICSKGFVRVIVFMAGPFVAKYPYENFLAVAALPSDSPVNAQYMK
jgi:hypothetical protein